MTIILPTLGDMTHEEQDSMNLSLFAEHDRRQTVLIIDDAKQNIVVLSKILKTHVDIVFSTSGGEGLEKARAIRPDLILLDIAMPDISGFDVLRELKKNADTQDIPVIIVTALPDTANEERGLKLGAVDYVIKPFSPAVVQARVSIHLRLQSLNRRLMEANKELLRLSTIDPLTGLYNRRHFISELRKGLQRLQRNGEKISLIILDIDDFKATNDRYGHDAGDRVLIHITRQIRSVLRADDVFGRLGGEEFAILLPRTGLEDAGDIASQLCQLMTSRQVPNGKDRISVSASFGVADFQRDDILPEQTMKKADLALYHAKRTGRNKVVLYDETLLNTMRDAALSQNDSRQNG